MPDPAAPDPSPHPEILIQRARPSDLPSLSTIVPRAFFRTNAFIRQCLPDTPAMRTWWTEVFDSEIAAADGECEPLTAFDVASGAVVGVLCLRRLNAASTAPGFWTLIPHCADTDLALLQPALDFLRDFWGRAFGREEGKGGGEGEGRGEGMHYLLELFGVDADFQHRGVGRRLMARAAEIADAEGCPTVVQANGMAVGFYVKHGFEELERMKMPGHIDYEECLLVRRGKGARDGV